MNETDKLSLSVRKLGKLLQGMNSADVHEELAERERALRGTRIRSIDKMEELKRVQELRVDEFSRRRMIESQQEYRNCKMSSSV